jgi:hypothetical protein
VERVARTEHVCWRFDFFIATRSRTPLLVLARPGERLAEVAASRNGKDGSVYTIERTTEGDRNKNERQTTAASRSRGLYVGVFQLSDRFKCIVVSSSIEHRLLG